MREIIWFKNENRWVSYFALRGKTGSYINGYGYGKNKYTSYPTMIKDKVHHQKSKSFKFKCFIEVI